MLFAKVQPKKMNITHVLQKGRGYIASYSARLLHLFVMINYVTFVAIALRFQSLKYPDTAVAVYVYSAFIPNASSHSQFIS